MKKTQEQASSEIESVISGRYTLIKYVDCKNVLIADKYGIIKTNISDIKRGYSFTINSAVDKDSYAKNRIKEKFPELDISKVSGIKNGASICIVSNIHGELSYTYNDLVLNKKTKLNIKSATNKTSYFISLSKEVHGDKYDYSAIKYTGAKSKISVICRRHGCFPVSASHFLNSKSGCPKCAHEKISEFQKSTPSGWGHETWKIQGESSKFFTGFMLYIIKAWDDKEEFIKIGRTFRPINRRFYPYIFPYNFESICELKGTAKEICEAEVYLKSLMKELRYKPTKKFLGSDECFTIPNLKLYD